MSWDERYGPMPHFMKGYETVSKRKLNRSASSYARRALVAMFKKHHLPKLIERLAESFHEANRHDPPKPMAIPSVAVHFDMRSLAEGVALHSTVSSGRREKLTEEERMIREYEAELKAWRRKRTVARSKVAKYSRLVRYHRSKRRSPVGK